MLKFKSIRVAKEYLEDCNPEALMADGHENALIGVVEKFEGCVAAYDTDIIIKNLMAMGMTDEEAEEFFRFNIIGAHVGPYTPVYLIGAVNKK
jgi:hypothetical protein